MKTTLFVMLSVVIMIGAVAQAQGQKINQEQESATKEIAGVVDAIVRGLETMDADTLFQSYQESPEFILFTTDGSMVGYGAAKAHHVKWFNSLLSLKVTPVREEYRYLPGKAVLCAWRGKFAMTLKAGGEPKVDFAITFVFQKIGDCWKVTYQQTSALSTGA